MPLCLVEEDVKHIFLNFFGNCKMENDIFK
jgi:hypothetical protein